MERIGGLRRAVAEPGRVGRKILAGERPALPLADRRPAPPLVLDEEIAAEGRPLEGHEVHAAGAARRAMDELVDPAARAVDAVVIVALAGVGPVGDVHAAVGALDEIHAAVERIVNERHVGAVGGGVAGPLGREQIVVDAAAVEIEREQPAAVGGRPVGALIDHQADVGVAAAGGARLVGDAEADVAPLLARVPVDVVGHLGDEVVDVRLEIGAVHPFDVRAVDGVPEVADDGVDDEGLAVGVEVGAPGIGHPGDHPLDRLAGRVVAPHTGVHVDALRVAGAGDADPRRPLDPVAGPQPAVGAPLETVAGGVADALLVDAVEDDLRRAVGHEVVVAVGNEEEVGEVDDPGAAEAHRHARHPRAAVPEDRPLVVRAVAVGVGEDHEPVAEGVVPGAEVVAGPGEVLRHPHPPLVVGAEADRVLHVGLGGEDLQLESGGEFGGAADLGRIHGRLGRLLGVPGNGKGHRLRRRLIGPQEQGEGEDEPASERRRERERANREGRATHEDPRKRDCRAREDDPPGTAV